MKLGNKGSDLTPTETNAGLSTGNCLSSQGSGKTRMNMQIKTKAEKSIKVLIFSSCTLTTKMNHLPQVFWSQMQSMAKHIQLNTLRTTLQTVKWTEDQDLFVFQIIYKFEKSLHSKHVSHSYPIICMHIQFNFIKTTAGPLKRVSEI